MKKHLNDFRRFSLRESDGQGREATKRMMMDIFETISDSYLIKHYYTEEMYTRYEQFLDSARQELLSMLSDMVDSGKFDHVTTEAEAAKTIRGLDFDRGDWDENKESAWKRGFLGDYD